MLAELPPRPCSDSLRAGVGQDSRCLRKQGEESPGFTGQGAR